MKKATQPDSFTFLRTYYEAFTKMDDAAKLDYLNGILTYCFEGSKPVFQTSMADMAFTLIHPLLENSVQHHIAQRENGRKGGRPRKTKPEEMSAKKTQPKPDQNPTETQIKRDSNSNSNSESNSNSNNDSNSNNHSQSLTAERPFAAPEAQRMERTECSPLDFDALWRAYPRKENRLGAYAAYFKTNLPSEILIPVIEAQKPLFAKRNKKYIPTLRTWLEEEMYSRTDCLQKKEASHIEFPAGNRKCAGA